MKVEEAIWKAIEGGFDQKYAHYAQWEHQVETLLDPSFWQLLGKVLGWKTDQFWDEVGARSFCRRCGINEHFDDDEPECIPQWKWNWHRFIDHLAAGKTTEEFFEGLN